MVAGDRSQPVDCLVVGGGPAGYTAALRAAQCGRSVTLVEQGSVGGVCLNRGCAAALALVELAELADRTRALAAAGFPPAAGAVDLAAFQSWKADLAASSREQLRARLERNGVRLLEGSARFSGRTRVAVQLAEESAEYFDFKDVVIATGSEPRVLPGFAFDGERVCDVSTALEWDHLPAGLIVCGGDYLGLELAVAFARLGARICLVEAGERLLPTFDPELSLAALEGARQVGVEVLLRSELRGLDESAAALVTPEGELRRRAERLVVSVGRLPRLADLDLAAAHIKQPESTFRVDSQLRVERHVFAAGDVTEGPLLAHRARAQGRVVGEVLGGRPSAMESLVWPEVVFSEPQLANVGLTEEQALGLGMEVATARLSHSNPGWGLGKRWEGWVKVVHERKSGRVLGVQLAGRDVAEVAAVAVTAIEMGATLEDLSLMVQPHPSRAEALVEVAEMGLERPMHLPPP